MPEQKKKKRGPANVPVVMQLEAVECGAACLTMILAYYKKWVPLEQVRIDCGVSRDGSSAKNIVLAARRYGMKANGFRYEPATLAADDVFPCIIHWNFNHFVVLKGFRHGKAYINDPAQGAIVLSMQQFDEGFTGIALCFRPTEAFVPGGKKKSMLGYAAKRLKGTGPAITFTVLTGVVGAMTALISPAISRVFIDRMLGGGAPDWVRPFLLFLFVVNIIRILLSALNSIYSLRIDGKLSVIGSTSYIWKVLHLPMSFFSARSAGDIQQRQYSSAEISRTLIQTVAPLLLQSVMMVFYLVVMLRYSVLLTLVGLVSLTVNAVVARIITKKRVNISRVSMRDEAALASDTVTGINMIETIKSSGAENGFFARWSGHQAAANAQRMKNIRLSQQLGVIPDLISLLADNAVLLLGVWLIMRGDFTQGMVMAFQSFLSSFMDPALQLVRAGQTLEEIRTQMERVEDVMSYQEDCPFSGDPDGTTFSHKLTGSIEIRGLTFGYSPLSEPLLKNLSTEIRQGSAVAFVGGSGCGKSTLSRLIAGLYSPWDGEILFDGKRVSEIPESIFHGSVAVVDQDITLFEDTIANNIKMWDESIEDFEMILAARDARIHDDIMARDKGYQSLIRENGSDLSGGQRQRLEIARVLAQDPTIIILDEATSALDAKTEAEVVQAIRDRGITCVVIAHRLSTIRDCDKILVMKDGEIRNEGTHDELMRTSELYRELVSNE